MSQATKQNTAHDKSLRRLALQLVSELPDQHEDALKVVGYMQALLEGFLDRKAAKQVIARVDAANT